MADHDAKYMPIEVDLANHKAARKIRFQWEDGHQAFYPFEYLRGCCPCASCQGHFEPRKFVLVKGATLARVELVGNYAFNLIWADGHDGGRERLRQQVAAEVPGQDGSAGGRLLLVARRSR